jgi:hypothetical protein
LRPFPALTRKISVPGINRFLPLAVDAYERFLGTPAIRSFMRVTSPLLVLNFLLAALFAVFAWMQRNDIDPAIYDHPSVIDAALWLVFYLAVGVMLVVVGFRHLPRWLLVISATACLVEMVRTGPGLYENLAGEKDFTITQESMSAEDPRVELSREFFGAVIALAGIGLIAWENRRGEHR